MTIRKRRRGMGTTRHTKQASAMLSAIVAVASGLAAGQAAALELGSIEVHSGLGQPLRASVSFAAGPNEMLESHCVSLAYDRSGSADLLGTRISVADRVISLTGHAPVNEPLLTASLVINCPGTMNESREYFIFVDPVEQPAGIASRSSPEMRAIPTTAPTYSAKPATTEPVIIGSRYQVRPRDSLSSIVLRLEGRKVGVQEAMAGILEANPDAFADQDPARLQAGSWLDIPAFLGTAVGAESADPIKPVSVESPERSPIDSPSVAFTDDAGSTYEFGLGEPGIPDETAAMSDQLLPSAKETSDDLTGAAGGFDTLRPGDIVDEALIAAAPPRSIVIPDTSTAAPADAAAPTMPVARKTTGNWLPWALVVIFAAVSAYLAFGARLRRLYASRSIGAAVKGHAAEPVSNGAAAITVPETETWIEDIQRASGTVDFDLSDDSPTEENLALDADLLSGAGFEVVSDAVHHEDFGFVAQASIESEPEDKPAFMEFTDTDVIAPPERANVEVILESEVLPDDDEYDISMIVDATKMPNPADVTERDLKAVPVDEDNDRMLISAIYEISNGPDFGLPERDCDDPLTATQALNAEIDKATAALAHDPNEADDASGETTVQARPAIVNDQDLPLEVSDSDDKVEINIDDTAIFKPDDMSEIAAMISRLPPP